MTEAAHITQSMHLDEVARHLARQHQLATAGAGQPLLLERLARYAVILDRAYQTWVKPAAQDELLPFAAEWLLDNYYLVRQALHQIEEDLPPSYYAELPLVDEAAPSAADAAKPSADTSTATLVPRVYVIAKALVQQRTLHPALETEIEFLRAYQAETPLTIGELWAVPTLLRYALIERLALAAARLTHEMDVLLKMTGLSAAMDGLPVNADGASPANDDSIVADAIIGLRALHNADWHLFFEAVSLVHQTLAEDPAKVYVAMTYHTRDHYREEVERLARYSRRSETEVAAIAVDLARAAAQEAAGGADAQAAKVEQPARRSHVGYYLLGQGRAQLEARIGYAPPPAKRLRRALYAHPTAVYLGSIGLLSLALLILLSAACGAAGAAGWQMAVALVLGIVPALTVAVSLVNWGLTQLLPPRILPKLELEAGVPAAARTMVVIPGMINRTQDVDDLFRQLELHYLRNADPNGHVTFAVLTDFGDAEAETLPDDAALLAHAQETAARLNRQYPGRPFYFFHRKRLWNSSEGVWMGWERKRGKLHEFNRLLRISVDAATGKHSTHDTSFVAAEGDLTILPGVRYVITLDADTVLPRDAARRLVATLTHPLNRAEFDPVSGRVVAGYTVLQPRTEINATSANRSLFTEIYAGDVGIDLYTLAVSNVYQDLFGEGIYVGKGIYDVDAFERSLEGRVPENSLLSHDLFEGIHGRAGLATDIILFEDYPPHYLVHMRRARRWIRGDWQLVPWLARRVPYHGGYAPNPLPAIARWKIVDNLRRSLLTPALLLWFVAGWTILPGSPWLWTLAGIVIPAVPVLTGALEALARSLRRDGTREALRPLWKSVARWLLQLVFLPYEAVLNLYAIGITAVRLAVTRRHMLQWVTSAHAARLVGENTTLDTTLQWMLPSLSVLLPIALLTVWLRPAALPVALPVWLAWVAAPAIAYTISRPRVPAVYTPSAQELQQLRTLARRTWLFYEQFVGPDDHWLPPDHFQESPKGVVAHRTSPTNVGLYLAAALAAHDLGYINGVNLALRLRSAFDTLAQLEHHRGHLLNWFDTQTLTTLTPAYVSTVDSGNLAAALVALRQGCLELPRRPLLRWELWQGLGDALALLVGEVQAVGDEEGEEAEPAQAARRALLQQIDQWQTTVDAAHDQPQQWPALVDSLIQEARPQLDQAILAFVDAHPEALGSERLHTLHTYSVMLHRQLTNFQHELGLLAPVQMIVHHPPHLLEGDALPAPVLRPWKLLRRRLPANPSLGEAEAGYGDALAQAQQLHAALQTLATHAKDQAMATDAPTQSALADAVSWSAQLVETLRTSHTAVHSLLTELAAIAKDAASIVAEMDFSFLFDAQRKLFYIGYNAAAARYDANYYDLLASEARLASLLAIAKGDVPQSHWLHMGRPFTTLQGQPVLLSWSGTMFEYLMPLLLARGYPGTLLHESCVAAVARQRRHGHDHHVPWGVSESGFYQFDIALNYQYRAFGVPGLGLKRGLDEDLVIAPYASLLAVGLAPEAVLQNLSRLQAEQAQGRYGLYEAIDYTERRLPLGQKKGMVRSYMAHHQGMILLALANYLQDDRMVARFHADPAIESVELLLQEQVPHAPTVDALTETQATAPLHLGTPAPSVPPWRVPLDSPLPLAHLLANGRFTTLITNSGAGFSTWNKLALTRWRPDPTLDDWGLWVYVQDMATGELWSVGRQPVGAAAEGEEVFFYPHMAEFRHRRGPLGVQMEVTVAPDADVEVRRITLTNSGEETQRLRVTSYAEVVLGDGVADARHQAFAKLFVESEYLPQLNALLFRRRPRSGDEHPPFMAHALTSETARPAGAYESDRARFLGRGRTARRPDALTGADWLSGTAGATLDPVMALGEEVEIAPHSMVELAFVTVAGETRQEVQSLLARFQTWTSVTLAFAAARSQADQMWREQDLTADDLAAFDQMLSLLFYPHAAGRADPATLAQNRLGQPSLWSFGISGDYPILLLQLRQAEQGALLRRLIQAHTYWRRRGLMIDLVIVNEEESNYGQAVHGAIWRLLQRMEVDQTLNQRGGIFLVRRDQMRPEEYILLQSVARVALNAEQGTLEAQLGRLAAAPNPLPDLITALPPEANDGPMPPPARPQDLHFDNGWGGFSPDGREYIAYLEPDAMTPAPWINVIANPDFGFLASESGGGYSWAVNSGENRLTTWRNDPVSDLPSEALYLRDEETGQVWSPLPLPAPAPTPYVVRHGPGYTSYEHHSHGVAQEVRLYVAPDAPLKFVRVRLRNQLGRGRRITLTFYAEWVLGVNRTLSQAMILPEVSGSGSPVLLATNPYQTEFAARCAFVAADKPIHGFSADRTEFLGRNGDYAHPAALRRVGLSNQVQPGQDPCAVLQVHVDLASADEGGDAEGAGEAGVEQELLFVLGQGRDAEEAHDLVKRYCTLDAAEAAWQATATTWQEVLGTVQVQTPEPSMDLLLNRWLPYQALACRIWGRSALYQSSGAYGFRDQLQDVLALIYARPDIVRAQLLRAARHQFEAGDVLHWWHPPGGHGVRTRISDDLLWLPYVTAHYVAATGDHGVLDETIPFLRGDPLRPDEEERYAEYQTSDQTATLYEHCLRAFAKGITQGPHGLPLMGTGDWNDGMNRVGVEGQGESVWLGWFIYATAKAFADVAESLGRGRDAERLRDQAEKLCQALAAHAWDGQWYLRAYYDDGSPLGSAQNQECRIDSIAQSWSVLSGAAEPARARQAMEAVRANLVKEDARLILLFTPPINKTRRDPGYIKGYPPGVRENGGQYTHAALWSIWAWTELGDGDLAQSLFQLINPITRADSAVKAGVYKVEPYVISADVYGVAPHVGRGGWTWYTGSSGWMYRLGVEAILGLRRDAQSLWLEPCIPAHWPGFKLTYRLGRTCYRFTVENPDGVQRGDTTVSLDGQPLSSGRVPLVDDGQEHQVCVVLRRADSAD
ncbi:MAG: hypothetical protein IT329_01820 [Caldilineaceae bacterium]|nr:hypothetical protein [Caldilineaceae bacterium]